MKKIVLMYAFLGLASASLSVPLVAHVNDGNISYVQDPQGRTMIFRKQPSWWTCAAGTVLTAMGGGIIVAALHGVEMTLDTKTSLLRTQYVNINHHNSSTSSINTGLVGIGTTLGGLFVTYDWYYDWSRIAKPLIILDPQGMWYEGKSRKIPWAELKGLRLIDSPVYDAEGRFLRYEYLIEIIDMHERWELKDRRLAITREALYEFMLDYYEQATGKTLRVS